jgi:hypothetical protein
MLTGNTLRNHLVSPGWPLLDNFLNHSVEAVFRMPCWL